MHHHLEVILPPVVDLKASLDQIMSRFGEEVEDVDNAISCPECGENCGYENRYSFWDYYVIGGRWAGAKLEASLDKSKMMSFRQELVNRGVTISSFRTGKPELSPSSQIPMVDSLWNEFFPESQLKACPLFNHFNDQYKDSVDYPDVMRLKDMPTSLTAERVIIAGPHYGEEDKLEAKFMAQEEFWNGVNYYDSKWNRVVIDAINEYKEKIKDHAEDYKEKHMPKDDWLVVTVDYHS